MNTPVVILASMVAWNLVALGVSKAEPVSIKSVPPTLLPQKHVAEISGYFRAVKITDSLKNSCEQAIKKMKIAKTVAGEKPVQTMEEAQQLIWASIGIAVGVGPRACLEYEGWFMISRLNWGNPDDGSFKSGFAVKKGTAEIYQWNE